MAKNSTTAIDIPPPNIQTLQLTVIGESPLIVHAWSDKAKAQMLAKQMKKATPKKEAKDPEADYETCFYRTPDGRYGFPAIGFKAAAVSACRYISGVPMTIARGAVHIRGEIVPIEGTPRPREDMVRVGMGVADIRYRPEFPEWRATLLVQFDANTLSAEQVVNLFAMAGFAVGVGEWRPERGGGYGRFRLAQEKDLKPPKRKRKSS